MRQGAPRGPRRMLGDERGSAVVESLLVTVLLTALTLGLLQLGLALHVRNTVHDAAAEGARHAALADSSLDAGVERTRALITTAIGSAYAEQVRAEYLHYAGHPAVAVTVRATLPVLGLLGPAGAMEVTGHAAREPEVG